MADKPKIPATPDTKRYPRKTVPCECGPSDDEKGRAYATLLNSPEFAATRIITIMQPQNLADDIDFPTMLASLRDQTAAVQGGDLTHAESMLINQASALQALFVRLTERAMQHTHMPNLEGFMRLALRAQSQCRATLETLANIKNPPIVYAKQANIAHNQQVNQSVTTGVPNDATLAHAGKFEPVPTQLLEAKAYERLDTRTASTPSGINQAVATLEPVNRA